MPEAEILLGKAILPLPLTQAGVQTQSCLALADASRIFPQSPHPAAALAGLALQLRDWETAHSIAQDIASVEGSYWHAILHRMEPDPFNANYWFRRVGQHAIFPALRHAASLILERHAVAGYSLAQNWQPDRFVTWLGKVLQSGHADAVTAATAIQAAEISLLFSFCAGD